MQVLYKLKSFIQSKSYIIPIKSIYSINKLKKKNHVFFIISADKTEAKNIFCFLQKHMKIKEIIIKNAFSVIN